MSPSGPAKEAGVFLNSDERILGDTDFVDTALQAAEEDLEKKTWYRREEVDLEKLISIVANALGIAEGEVCAAGKHPKQVKARSLLCYWAVREIGMTGISLAKVLRISQPAVTQAIERGERLAAERGLQLKDLLGGNL